MSVSRQLVYQQRRLEEGACRQCGQDRDDDTVMCDRCLVLNRERMRERTGSQPWRPGGPGRPPKGRTQ